MFDDDDIDTPDPKNWLYPLLAVLGITRIEANLSGSGDSGDIDDVIWFNGDHVISPEGENAKIQPPDSGVVLAWLVSDGAIVRMGDPLCEVDPVEAREELDLCRDRLALLLEQCGESLTPQEGTDQSDLHEELRELTSRIPELQQRVANTLLIAPADGFVNTFDPATAMNGFRAGDSLLTLTPLTHIDTILSKLTIDDGAFAQKTFLDEVHTMLEKDASAAGNWYDGDGGSVFSTYELDPELGRIRLTDADYTPGEEYDDDEDDDWEPEFGEPEEKDDDLDVEP